MKRYEKMVLNYQRKKYEKKITFGSFTQEIIKIAKFS